MIDETAKLDEFEIVCEKYIELIKYFVQKQMAKDLNPEDNERYGAILGKICVSASEIFKGTFGMNNEQVAEVMKAGLDITDDNIKNS